MIVTKEHLIAQIKKMILEYAIMEKENMKIEININYIRKDLDMKVTKKL